MKNVFLGGSESVFSLCWFFFFFIWKCIFLLTSVHFWKKILRGARSEIFFFHFFFSSCISLNFAGSREFFSGCSLPVMRAGFSVLFVPCSRNGFFCWLCCAKKTLSPIKKFLKKKKKKNPRGSLFPFFGISSFSFKYKWIHVILFRGSPLLGIVLTFLFTFFPRGSQVFLKKNSESEGLA